MKISEHDRIRLAILADKAEALDTKEYNEYKQYYKQLKTKYSISNPYCIDISTGNIILME